MYVCMYVCMHACIHDVDQEQIAAMDVRNRKIVVMAKRWKSAKGTARTCVLFQDGNRRF